jgi:hypothetical protein
MYYTVQYTSTVEKLRREEVRQISAPKKLAFRDIAWLCGLKKSREIDCECLVHRRRTEESSIGGRQRQKSKK